MWRQTALENCLSAFCSVAKVAEVTLSYLFQKTGLLDDDI